MSKKSWLARPQC